MAGVQKFASHVIDYAERLSTMADVAEGKKRRSGTARWFILPASGAALYALVKSDAFSKQAKGVVREARARAADLPEDLISRVRETAQASSSRRGSKNGAGAKRSSSRSRNTKSRA